MIRTVRAFVALACTSVLAPAQVGDWVFVGPPAISAANVTSSQIAIDAAGVPYVAYQDLYPGLGTRASVQRFVGGAWSYVGAPGGASIGTAWYNQLAFTPDGSLLLAARDYSVGGRVSVRRFAPGATSWTSVGPGGITAGEAHHTAIAIAPDGNPWVAYADRVTTPVDRSSAMRWDGTSWRYVGPQGLSPNTAGYQSLAFDALGRAWIAYTDADHLDAFGGGRATVARWNATTEAWEIVGPPGFTPSAAFNLRIVADRYGVPWVVWYDYHSKIVVHRFDGTGWPVIGGSASGPDKPDVMTEGWRQWMSLVFDSQNRPYVAYQLWLGGYKAAVRRFDGASWQPVGTIGFTPGAADYLTLAIDPDDVPYVAFRDAVNNGGMSVMRFAPAAQTYCVAKTSSLGCTPSIAASGAASASGSGTCVVSASGVASHKTGILLWSHGPAATPFLGGTLCLSAPILRTDPQSSGGTPGVDDCSGAYSIDLNPLLASGAGGFVPGEMLFAQYWFRDPGDAFGTGLSNAVRVAVGP